MADQDNKTLLRRFFEEVWNEGNLDAINDFAADEVVVQDPVAGEIRGPDGVRDFINTYRSAFPDVRITVEEQIAEGDTVVTRWTARGTHRGELMGIPPTGKTATVAGISIDRIAGGKFVESTGNWDALGMLQQLGVIPEQVGA